MNDHLPDCLTAQHLQLFGAIVQWFARYELLMQEIMAALCGTDAAAVMLLTRRLDFGGKRATLLDLLRQRRIPMDQFGRICAYLLIPHTYAPLRHDIAHSAWTSSQHSGSVQPNWIIGLPSGITPLRDDFNALTETFIERTDMEFNYTIGDLKEIVRILADNHEALSDTFMKLGWSGFPEHRLCMGVAAWRGLFVFSEQSVPRAERRHGFSTPGIFAKIAH